MRRAAKIDANQVATVKALRDCGMSVCLLSAVGKGVPDLLVGWRGVNVLIELKDGAKKPSEQSLTKDQQDFHATWNGQVIVANSPTAAVEAVIRHWESVHD